MSEGEPAVIADNFRLLADELEATSLAQRLLSAYIEADATKRAAALGALLAVRLAELSAEDDHGAT